MKTDSINKEKSRELRQKGMAITKIAAELHVAKSSVSLWTRDIILTELQKQELVFRPLLDFQAEANKLFFRKKRVGYQRNGRDRVKTGEPLYIAGCMLYWGEGSKSRNTCGICNSELALLKMFKQFLETYFLVSPDDIAVTINAYTDYHSPSEIEKYWIDGLQLKQHNLRKNLWNNKPSSSKLKTSKLEYGTCRISICRTDIVQEIFGAIQEFANFSNPKWLG